MLTAHLLGWIIRDEYLDHPNMRIIKIAQFQRLRGEDHHQWCLGYRGHITLATDWCLTTSDMEWFLEDK